MKPRRAAMWTLAALAVAGFAAFDRVSAAMESQNQGFGWGSEGPTDEQVSLLAFQQMSYSFLNPALITLASLSLFALLVIAARAVAVRWARGAEPEASAPSPFERPLLGDAHDERARVDAEVGRDH